jgi:hypothetical protein
MPTPPQGKASIAAKNHHRQHTRKVGALEAIRFVLDDDSFLAYIQEHDPNLYDIVKNEPRSLLVAYRALYAKMCMAQAGVSSDSLSLDAQRNEARFLHAFQQLKAEHHHHQPAFAADAAASDSL